MPSGFRLRPPAFVHPLLFQRGRPANLDGFFNEDGTLSVYGQRLDFAEPPVGLNPGTVLEIEMEGTVLFAYPLGTRAEREAARRLDVAAAEEARQLEDRRQQEEAARTNAALRVPVRWTSGQKSVMSGLSETSFGDGRNKRTVNHVLLLEDIREPRFSRRSGEFLCATPRASNGTALSGLATYFIGSAGPFVPQITCWTCLRVAHRWRRAEKAVPPELILV